MESMRTLNVVIFRVDNEQQLIFSVIDYYSTSAVQAFNRIDGVTDKTFSDFDIKKKKKKEANKAKNKMNSKLERKTDFPSAFIRNKDDQK